MENANLLIDALQNGASQEDLEARFPGGALTPAEYEDLFAHAKALGRSPVAFNLLVYLVRVTKDEWFRVRVLALLAQHGSDPATDPSHDRAGRLAAMRQSLDAIAMTLPDQGEQVVHYQKLNAFYYVLAARSRRDVGDLDRALGWYETALGLYTGLGLTASAQKVMQELQALHVERRAFAMSRGNRDVPTSQAEPSSTPAASPAPQQQVTAPTEPAEPELSTYVESFSTPTAAVLVGLDEETKSLQARRDSLSIEVSDLEGRRGALLAQENETENRLQTLEAQVQDQQRVLGEKQALIKQMEHLSEEEVRLRQTLDQLARQEKERLGRIESLQNEINLLQKQLDILKRQAVDPGQALPPVQSMDESHWESS
ncbi:MAG TPA: hypothetical protein VMT46_12630 [Anaerolineaceae bacterium]|nr:hypothetical protein [Anaerolineaceae bacterium]